MPTCIAGNEEEREVGLGFPLKRAVGGGSGAMTVPSFLTLVESGNYLAINISNKKSCATCIIFKKNVTALSYYLSLSDIFRCEIMTTLCFAVTGLCSRGVDRGLDWK